MATVTVLFAKSTIHLLSTSFITGENQFTNFSAWLITGVTVGTAINQVEKYLFLLFYILFCLFLVECGKKRVINLRGSRLTCFQKKLGLLDQYGSTTVRCASPDSSFLRGLDGV